MENCKCHKMIFVKVKLLPIGEKSRKLSQKICSNQANLFIGMLLQTTPGTYLFNSFAAWFWEIVKLDFICHQLKRYCYDPANFIISNNN